MAGMDLDGKGAKVEGNQALPGGARLRWGTSAKGPFCATVAGPTMSLGSAAEGHMIWQFCAPDSPSRREAILAIAKGFTKAAPKSHMLECENTGC